MNVKVLRNFIYDGAFRAKDDVFDMPAEDVPEYESRGNVIRLLQKNSPPAQAPDALNELPPLDTGRKKR